MAVSKETLRKEINAILKDADLSKTSAKKVRQELEKRLDCDLTDRKKEVDQLVMDFINNQSDSEEEEDDDDGSEDERPSKRASSGKKPAANKRRGSSDESDEGSDKDDGDDDYKPNKGAKAKGSAKKKRADSDSGGSDGEWKRPKAKKAATASAGKGKGKGSGFTRPLQLSPELASLMGAEAMPRHEVVKKVWAIIKERNLYDPKNKQFAICDADLQKVIGVKRFRTFGMMKYLQPHFITN